jgi:hypothetical protein
MSFSSSAVDQCGYRLGTTARLIAVRLAGHDLQGRRNGDLDAPHRPPGPAGTSHPACCAVSPTCLHRPRCRHAKPSPAKEPPPSASNGSRCQPSRAGLPHSVSLGRAVAPEPATARGRRPCTRSGRTTRPRFQAEFCPTRKRSVGSNPVSPTTITPNQTALLRRSRLVHVGCLARGVSSSG